MIDLSVPEGQTEKGNKLDLSQKAEPVSEFGFRVRVIPCSHVRRREHKNIQPPRVRHHASEDGRSWKMPDLRARYRRAAVGSSLTPQA